MSSLAPSVLMLFQAVSDSAATRVVVERTWLDTVASIGLSLVSLVVLVTLVLGVALLYALKKSIDELTKLIRNAYEPLKGALTETREVASEVRAIVKSLKEPLALAGETIEDASDRVRSVMDVAEGRIARLDELVGIAQEQAEGAVVGAASFFRGMAAGGRSVRRSFGKSADSRKAKALARRRRARAERDALAEDEDVRIDTRRDEAPRIRSRAADRR